MKTAIQSGDATALRRLLMEDPARANQLIEWEKNYEIRTYVPIPGCSPPCAASGGNYLKGMSTSE